MPHGIDVDMAAEAEGMRLLAAVEEEGLDEVSFISQKGLGSRSPIFLHLQLCMAVVTVFSQLGGKGIEALFIGPGLIIRYSFYVIYAIFCTLLSRS